MPKEEILFRISEWRLEKNEFTRYRSGKNQIGHEQFLLECCGLPPHSNTTHFLFDDFWSGKRDRFFTESYSKESRKT